MKDVLERAEQIAGEIVAPNAEAVDAEYRWPEAGLRALQGELGGLVVPEDSGGLGHGLLALAQVCEILGRRCSSTALCFGMHCVGAAVIAAKATPEQQDVYLRAISSGTHLTTLALSEPGTGAHFWLPQTVLAETEEDGYRVTGTKTFVTNGGQADSYVMSTVAADPQAPPGQFSCVVVPASAPGVEWGDPWRGLGMRGNAARPVNLRDVPIRRRDLLGGEGDQIWYVFNVVAPFFLVAMSGTYLGIATAALDTATQHLRARQYTHTGATLAQQTVLQHRLGSLWAQVERTRRLLYFAAEEGDTAGPLAVPALCSAKAEVADCAVTVANEAMTLVGGIGYRGGSSLDRLLRDARAAHVMSPTTDLLRTWVGRALLDEHILGD